MDIQKMLAQMKAGGGEDTNGNQSDDSSDEMPELEVSDVPSASASQTSSLTSSCNLVLQDVPASSV